MIMVFDVVHVGRFSKDDVQAPVRDSTKGHPLST